MGGYAIVRWQQTGNIGYVPNQYHQKVFMATAVDLPDFNCKWHAYVSLCLCKISVDDFSLILFKALW